MEVLPAFEMKDPGLSERVKRALKVRGLKPHDLERVDSKVSHRPFGKGQLYRLANGDRKAKLDTVQKLATFLSVDFSWLSTGQGPEPVPDTALSESLRRKLIRQDDEAVSSGLASAPGNAFAQPEGVEAMATMLAIRDIPNARYPRLEACLIYFADQPGRWSEHTIASARTGYFEPDCQEWTAQQWAEGMTRLESWMNQGRAKALHATKP